jgi:hypothetical protein
MGIYKEVYEESLLDKPRRQRFAALLDVPIEQFEQAFLHQGRTLTDAYYRYHDRTFDQAELARSFNRAGLACLTGISIPFAVPAMLAAAFSRRCIQRVMEAEKNHLQKIIRTLTPAAT